jgi:hypothetical protein
MLRGRSLRNFGIGSAEDIIARRDLKLEYFGKGFVFGVVFGVFMVFFFRFLIWCIFSS